MQIVITVTGKPVSTMKLALLRWKMRRLQRDVLIVVIGISFISLGLAVSVVIYVFLVFGEIYQLAKNPAWARI